MQEAGGKAEERGNQAQETDCNGENECNLFSPRFRCAARLAGWDEETLLLASLVVEDTPVREAKQRKRTSPLLIKSPPSSSKRRRRVRRQSPPLIPLAVPNLDDEDDYKKPEKATMPNVHAPAPLCLDRLREELSCAVCLDICFEPSTTPCGHSFCLRCLQSAAEKCGRKCPKCRQLISIGRACTINTVLWNTIQLLFPEEVEAKKKAVEERKRKRQIMAEAKRRPSRVLPTVSQSTSNRVLASHSTSNRVLASHSTSSRPVASLSTNNRALGRRRTPNQDEDAALALRLQREEFMAGFHDSQFPRRSTLSSARANLRAMASRAMRLRERSRPI
ncbi:E3 ubiquitin-protein ligase rnf168 [Amborella trichopoda]|uniref:RING-type E3 ubiquitin transferase n=1 Tax=Amborella trichopoda TaxID=13333 RepID=W1PZT5_AMBTC|nr:E3 ubiquitin-protein ligase rnf168 [Amborella trichopoda]ERN13606.1 hypothetical protein AMTR_s00049p00060930 [Amborella trichopoda]|eukprot:XP_020527578.1 E3 ubiquitin-protein ligase rnf168 [Amborella trichopoda]